ncbi:protein of unknown function DUF3880 [Desulfovibrio sp. X2]|uniref:CgeB family protein n=1 Tax=Desulfovibrio sp. X2 TaxID=941449 RepID=UPI000358CF05|nr:glycosyltransferase [Desulfovibrio sp. X2]EPR43890.1 protein of unknown function DUF3880 [Desulfovibrio sp. X2]
MADAPKHSPRNFPDDAARRPSALSYTVEPVVEDGRLTDLRLLVAAAGSAKAWHLLGRGGEETELRAVREFLAAPSGLPVLLGAGLGHGLALLLREWDGPVAVVDKEKAVQEAGGARAALSAEDAKRVLWLDMEEIGDDPQGEGGVLVALTRWQMSLGGRPFAPILHPVYARLDRDYYGSVREALSASRSFDFWARARYEKFREWPPRVLLVTSRYFLMGEIVAACERLGAPCRLIDMGAKEVGRAEFVQDLLHAVLEFRPDFVFTVNHLGVDREGILVDLLSRLELPLASWFVDNPHLILYVYERLNSPYTAIFTWDADNIASLRELGFETVRYLPLATDAHRFRPGRPGRPEWKSRVSFVGNSMVTKVEKRLEAAAPPPELAGRFEEIAAGFKESDERSVAAYLAARHAELLPFLKEMDTVERRLAFEALITWEATRQYRLSCVRATLPFSPLIVGDAAWKRLLPGEGDAWRWHHEVSYYDDLPGFYPCSEVNFNCTSKQMKGAVNQRVFDVPACGAFLVTDHREQMEELFAPGREVACYAEPGEAEDMVRHYLAHPAERERIVAAARERILRDHTYDLRVTQLFTAMRELFGRAV